MGPRSEPERDGRSLKPSGMSEMPAERLLAFTAWQTTQRPYKRGQSLVGDLFTLSFLNRLRTGAIIDFRSEGRNESLYSKDVHTRNLQKTLVHSHVWGLCQLELRIPHADPFILSYPRNDEPGRSVPIVCGRHRVRM